MWGRNGRDALRRVRSHPPVSPQNTQKPLRGALKTLNFGALSYISNTFRVFSDGLWPFSVFCGKRHPAPRLRPVNTERAEARGHGGWFLRLACARLHPLSVSGRDALRRVRSHESPPPPHLCESVSGEARICDISGRFLPSVSPQNTQKPLRGTLKTLKSGPLHASILSVCSVTAFGRSVCSVVNPAPPLLPLMAQIPPTADTDDDRDGNRRCMESVLRAAFLYGGADATERVPPGLCWRHGKLNDYVCFLFDYLLFDRFRECVTNRH